jgi:TolA-binding protein
MFSLASCGNNVRKLIGADYDNEVNRNDNRVTELERRVTQTENQIAQNIDDIAMLQDLIVQFTEDEMIQFTSFREDLDNLQGDTNNLLASLAVLQGYDSIIGYIDPCGDGAGYDEIIMQTVSGQLIAYFENGSFRFLSTLPDGNYRTTDQQSCNFSVVSGEYQE